MFWENTGQWTSQYTPATKTYIGSADDGGDDPQIGYAPYDFDPRPKKHPQTSASAAISNYGMFMLFAWFGKNVFPWLFDFVSPLNFGPWGAESPKCSFVEGKHYALLSTAKLRPHCQRRSLNRIRDVGCWLAGEVQIHPDPCTVWAEPSVNTSSPSSGENPFEAGTSTPFRRPARAS